MLVVKCSNQLALLGKSGTGLTLNMTGVIFLRSLLLQTTAPRQLANLVSYVRISFFFIHLEQ